jgi:outer membrane protein OmpA-like peptidoglycan-associated protein
MIVLEKLAIAAMSSMLVWSAPGIAQTSSGAEQQQEQDSLKIYFRTGSAGVDSDQEPTLDQAARLFREGSPIVMISTGGADTVGAPEDNLELSIERAQAVVDGLVARGIPVERLQVLGRGITDLAVKTEAGVSSRENRVVEITWR